MHVGEPGQVGAHAQPARCSSGLVPSLRFERALFAAHVSLRVLLYCYSRLCVCAVWLWFVLINISTSPPTHVYTTNPNPPRPDLGPPALALAPYISRISGGRAARAALARP
jgi:hypothetical protein